MRKKIAIKIRILIKEKELKDDCYDMLEWKIEMS
jgi:hypothetical protein